MLFRKRTRSNRLIPLLSVMLMTAMLFMLSVDSEAAGSRQLQGVKITVDPGHGGSDPGAVGPRGLTESEVNLRVATALRNCLVEYGGAQIQMTRTSNRYVSLSERVYKANSWGAARFISIHHNGSTNRWVNGTSTFSHPKGSWASHDLSNKVQRRLLAATALSNHGTQRANFHVLRNTKMPAILTEASFITNPYEEARLRDPGYTWRQGFYIYLGIADHFGVKP